MKLTKFMLSVWFSEQHPGMVGPALRMEQIFPPRLYQQTLINPLPLFSKPNIFGDMDPCSLIHLPTNLWWIWWGSCFHNSSDDKVLPLPNDLPPTTSNPSSSQKPSICLSSSSCLRCYLESSLYQDFDALISYTPPVYSIWQHQPSPSISNLLTSWIVLRMLREYLGDYSECFLRSKC